MKERINDDTDRLLSINEMADRLNISIASMTKIMNNGYLPFVKCGRMGRNGGIRRYVRKVTFNKFLEQLEGQDLKTFIDDKEEIPGHGLQLCEA